MNLDSGAFREFLKAFGELPQKDKDEAIAFAEKECGALKFVPNPGPQTQAYYNEADELFYGGAAGGGKTALSCGLAVNEHHYSHIFRRESTQVRGIIEELAKILGSTTGLNRQSGVWQLPDGKVIELAGIKDETDKEKWQGRPADLKCVAAGTPVLMADGGWKPIEAIKVGDLVHTLSGPRSVTRTMRKTAEAVRVTAYLNGQVVAEQVQGATHRLLTPEGWVSQGSFASACDDVSERGQERCRTAAAPREVQPDWSWGRPQLQECAPRHHHRANSSAEPCSYAEVHGGSPIASCEPRERPDARKCAGPSTATCAIPSRSHSSQCEDRSPQQSRDRDREDCQSRSGSGVALASRDPGTDCAAIGNRSEAGERLASSCGPLAPATPVHVSAEVASAQRHRGYASEYVRCDPSPPDCRGGYWSGIGQCGGQLRSAGDVYLACLPRQDGAAARSPRSSRACDAVSIPERSRPLRSYRHPYSSEIRSSGADVYVATLNVLPAGNTELFDLTVEDANHYITSGGFINKNCFDEITHFTRSQYRFIIGWNRTTRKGQRCRVVATGNPPFTAEGLWVIKEWAPWLDPNHPDPALPGELRWPVRATDEENDESEIFFRSKEEAMEHLATLRTAPRDWEGNLLPPRSRSFIPAGLEDNPDLMRSGYASVIEAMPKELREAMKGSFSASLKDQEFQVIPSEWIAAAQARWIENGFKDYAMTAMGFDPAGGGRDTAELAWRHHGWFAPLVSAQGKETADGSLAAATIVQYRRDNAPVVVDAGGGAGHGFGGTTIMRLKDNGVAVLPYNGASSSLSKTRDGQFAFANKRAEAWWKLREDLDPDQEGGSIIALPPDPELRADLAAPTYEVTARGILIESKDEIRKRLGRSPGKGDAVVMCWSEGQRAVKRQIASGGQRSSMPRATNPNNTHYGTRRRHASRGRTGANSSSRSDSEQG